MAGGSGKAREPLPRKAGRCGRRARLCAGAARQRTAHPGRLGAAAGLVLPPDQHRGAGRLRPRIVGRRQPGAGASGPQQRPHAGSAGLAHPLGAGRGARPARPSRRGAARITRARSRSSRTTPACSPISASPTPSPRTSRRPRRRCGAPHRSAATIRACGRTSPSWSASQGRFAEAENIARADLPAEEAAANVATLRRMLAQQNDFKAIPQRPKLAAACRHLTTRQPPRRRSRHERRHLNCWIILMTAGPRMTMNSTGRKNRIIGTVSCGGSAAAFFSAAVMR